MSINYVQPNQMRQLRACMVCSIVMLRSVRSSSSSTGWVEYTASCSARPNPRQTSHFLHGGNLAPSLPYRLLTDLDVQRFKKEGCPNCEDFLGLRGSDDSIDACTSSVYDGLITLVDPSKSWVAKWQRLDGYVKGVYATKVMGQLPDELITEMEQNYKIRYMP